MRSAMMVEFHVYHGDSLIVVYRGRAREERLLLLLVGESERR